MSMAAIRRGMLLTGVLFAAIVGIAIAAAGQSGDVPTTFPATQHQPLADPPVLTSRHRILETTLTVAQTTYEVGGTRIRGKTYNGVMPGPTLVVDPGDLIMLRFRNELDQPTNIHFHGFHDSPVGFADNVLRTIPAHSTVPVVTQIPANMAPGTYWYHSHLDPNSESQVMDGLAGMIVVRGQREYLPPALRGVPEHIFALKDLQVKNGAAVTAGPRHSDISIGAPTTRTVNGHVDPTLTVRPGETQLWRLANISADITYQVRADSMPFHVIGEDGNPAARVGTKDTLLIPPGKRWDVLVQAPRAGRYGLRTLSYSTGPGGNSFPERTLATIVSSGPGTQPVALPAQQAIPHNLQPDLGSAHVDRRRTIVFSERNHGDSFFINGKQFDPHRIDERIKLGAIEEWTIRNTSDEQHPFHIHVNHFQVMSINGRPRNAPALQDTVMLPAHGNVVIRIHFTNFTGTSVFHCHILKHEDLGMMLTFNVVGPPAG
jgi:suppressor of ftsI